MVACSAFTDPIDAELHAAGCCLCALYPQSRPPMKHLNPEEAKHLLGLFGFALLDHGDGTWIAVDEVRGLRTPYVSGLSDHTIDDLGKLVVRARCTASLAGPLTIADATEQLRVLGFVLNHRDHRWHGRQWWATSQDREQTTGEWGRLASLVGAAQAMVRQDLYSAPRQERMLELTRQMPIDLGPQERIRTPEPPARSSRRWMDAAQLGLDLDAPVVPPSWKPKRRR